MSSASENNSLDSASYPPDTASSAVIVVMGVSGSGKTTLAMALAESLSLPFIDADDLHPQANRDKMSMGEPLTDADRAPWLVSVRRAAVEAAESNAHGTMSGVVVACSALKESYRQVLRGEGADPESDRVSPAQQAPLTPRPRPPRTFFVHPFGQQSALLERMTSRKSHFMKANMLQSQLDTLENPAETGEEGIVEIKLDAKPEEQVQAALDGLRTVRAIE
ncbi:P-loop containing nucleoside triphosphate hydrolase protein [Russula compacta]|nr:P-loop containing nucleoside triphosphate hydrolase protein [Russula compacta]